MTTVVFTGSREWDDSIPISKVMIRLGLSAAENHTQLRLVHGAAKGLDSIVHGIATPMAKNWGHEVIACPADWNTHTPVFCRCSQPLPTTCKAAGYARNAFMQDTYKPDRVIAFTDKLNPKMERPFPGGGTGHMTAYAMQRGMADIFWFSHSLGWQTIRKRLDD